MDPRFETTLGMKITLRMRLAFDPWIVALTLAMNYYYLFLWSAIAVVAFVDALGFSLILFKHLHI